jgi:DNA repair ATPase RecN
MSNSGADDRDGIAGLSLEEAVDTVIERGEAHERETAAEDLEAVVEDGVVSREALDDLASEVSKVVATAETRTELAEQALSEVEETADHVANLDTVAFRLDRFESQVENVSDWCDELGPRLDGALDRRDGGTVYEATTELREVRAAAGEVQSAADGLQSELQKFEHWLTHPDRRYGELGRDLDALEDSLFDLGDAIHELDHAVNEDGSVDPSALDVDDVGLGWVDTLMRIRVIDLFLDDVRAELADLRAWADREDLDADALDRIGDRLDDLDDECETIRDHLGSLGKSEWRRRFAKDLGAFDEELTEFEPPVDWDGVQELLEEYRSEAQSR